MTDYRKHYNYRDEHAGHEPMTHAEFQMLYRNGSVRVHVDKSKALRLVSSEEMDRRYRAAHTFWTWVWTLSFPISILLAIVIKWWVGLIAFVIGIMLFGAIRETACRFVIDRALEDERFYHSATEWGALRVVPKLKRSNNHPL